MRTECTTDPMPFQAAGGRAVLAHTTLIKLPLRCSRASASSPAVTDSRSAPPREGTADAPSGARAGHRQKNPPNRPRPIARHGGVPTDVMFSPVIAHINPNTTRQPKRGEEYGLAQPVERRMTVVRECKWVARSSHGVAQWFTG